MQCDYDDCLHVRGDAGSYQWSYSPTYPVKHNGGVQMMQMLPFYDDGAIRTLRGFEELVYQNLR
jgi:hypothetical protein